MNRTLLAVALALVVSVAVAEETAKPAKPIGIWTRGVGETTWSIEAEQDSLTLKGETAGKVFRITCPSYEISREGIAYGYIREIAYIDDGGEIVSLNKVLYPFAFRLKSDKDCLSLSDLRLYAFDKPTHEGLTGTFQKQADKTAAKPLPGKEVKQ